MQTLIKDSLDARWYPEQVATYKSSIKVYGPYEQTNRLRSNFAYSMQYIEYIEKQARELKLSEVLYSMLYKTYIITAMGIIEALFTNLLHHTKNWNTTSWEEYSVIASNPKKISDKETKIETHLFEKVDEYDMRMDLDSMIKRIEKKKLLSVDHDVFPVLKNLRELRNRVHLQVGVNAYDHDYNNFGYEEIVLMRRILYSIVTCKEFCKEASVFEFLNRSLFNREGR